MARHHSGARTQQKEITVNEFFSPLAQRAVVAQHSAGHSNALVENPFDEVEAVEAD